jgi:hypothetical protein
MAKPRDPIRDEIFIVGPSVLVKKKLLSFSRPSQTEKNGRKTKKQLKNKSVSNNNNNKK